MLPAVPSEKLQIIQAECRKAYQNRFMSMTERLPFSAERSIAHKWDLHRLHCTLRTAKTAHKHAAPPEDELPEQDHDFLIKGLINRSPKVDLTLSSSILMAIKSFLRTQPLKPQHISLQMGNSTAVAYVNKEGGTKSSTLAELVVEIWAVCHQNNIWITAHHLPGTQNVDADWVTRHFNERTEWTLDKTIFTRIVRKFYTPHVNLFASRLTNQLPRYASRHPDPEAMSVDAMTLQWNKWTSFIHPQNGSFWQNVDADKSSFDGSNFLE